MQKLFLLLIFAISGITLHAQVDSLQQYTGKFKFPEGTVITEMTITLDNGVLSATSVMGSSELKKTTEKDVFEVVAYSGITTFKRDTEGKLVGIKIEVGSMVMEGTKVETPPALR